MGTTKEDIKAWIKEGKDLGATHMVYNLRIDTEKQLKQSRSFNF